jgi:hypothetical protein
MTLLREIQSAAMDSTIPIPDVLRKCKVLAARLKNKPLAEWVDRELNGYPDAESTPEYRRAKVQSVGHFTGAFGAALKNAPLPSLCLPADLRHVATDQTFLEPIASLCEHIAKSKGALHAKWPPDIIAFVQTSFYENLVLGDAYRLIPTSIVVGIIDTIRTKVLDFALAIEGEAPDAGDVPPGAAPAILERTVSNIFHTTIVGGAANVGTSGHARASTGDVTLSQAIPAAERAKIEDAISRLSTETSTVTDAAERAEAEGALENVRAQLSGATPNKARAMQYLAFYAAIVTAASPTVTVLKAILDGLAPQ